MNKSQLIVLWIGISFFVYFALTTRTRYMDDRPAHYLEGTVREVANYGSLAGRLMSTVVVTGGLIYTLKDEKPKDEQDNK